MKRDMDLVRDLLLNLESRDTSQHGIVPINWPFENIAQPEHPAQEIQQHLECLMEAGLISGRFFPDGRGLMFKRLTWEGCDFLDAVRDDEVWRRTKDGASKMGGWTISLLKDLGTAYLKHVAKERLGLDF